ncbi:hypothetical protein A2U01_0102130, partial [Trifolium medium]|nr:hypothetical protein [Trifolium medium]
ACCHVLAPGAPFLAPGGKNLKAIPFMHTNFAWGAKLNAWGEKHSKQPKVF